MSTKEWTPSYSPWRHGGWYVDNVQYPSGAVGCVSRNYPDGKWRIVCGRPDDETFESRDAAARAEHALTLDLAFVARESLEWLANATTFDFQHGNDRFVRRSLAGALGLNPDDYSL